MELEVREQVEAAGPHRSPERRACGSRQVSGLTTAPGRSALARMARVQATTDSTRLTAAACPPLLPTLPTELVQLLPYL
jgi:hypothetical protein